MAPPKRYRPNATPAVPRGPNHQLNTLRDQLDSQLKADATFEATENPVIQEALEKEIYNRNRTMAGILDEFLHDPFTHQPISNFSDGEKYALGQLRAALVNELQQPSDSNKTTLEVANGSLVALMRPELRTAAERKRPWIPYSSINSAKDCPRNPDAEEAVALEWRPRQLRERDKADQSLYKIEDPNIKHCDPVDQETWDTIRHPEPITWNFTSTDTDSDKKDKKGRRIKKKKNRKRTKEQSPPEDNPEGERVTKRRGEAPLEDDGMMDMDSPRDKEVTEQREEVFPENDVVRVDDGSGDRLQDLLTAMGND